MNRMLLALLGSLLAVAPARAGDPTNTLSGTIVYEGKSPIADWKGSNPSVSGSITWNANARTVMSEVWVDLAKWDSGNALRDQHTRAMFEVEQFPKAHFRVTGLAGDVTSGDITLKGTLDLHGVEKNVEIPSKIKIVDGKVSFNGSVVLRVTEYGMKRPVLLGARVADEVKVNIQAEGKIP